VKPLKKDINDDALMAGTAQGQEAAFRLLVLRWEHDVIAFLTHMLGSREEAEDLAQETFVQVFRKSASYQGEGKFKSWLFRIAGNQARSKLWRRKFLRWVSFDASVHDVADKEQGNIEKMVEDESARLVREAVVTLPDRQREALVLLRFQGLKYREIAEVMGTTVPGVESLIQRAMGNLRTKMTGKGLES
jgi:RNA polymerase sigma-70 factor (ECF subfamily)